MRRAFFGLVVVVIGLWCAASTRAVPVPGVDIDMLTADSTLIIVGEVTSVQDLGRTTIRAGARSISASEMTATVRVDRVLKQSPTGPTSSIRFHFARPDEFVGWGAVNPLSYGMFFLVDEHGELNLTSPYQ